MTGKAVKIWMRFFLAVILIGGLASNSFAQTPTDSKGMAIGNWIFYPNLFAGMVYNSNVNQTNSGQVSSWGERLVPSFSANLNNGIHKTELYGLVDAQNYNSSGITNNPAVDAKAGFRQTYEAQRDLVFLFSGDFTRQLDVFGGTAFVADNKALEGVSPQVSPTSVSPQVNPNRYNQFTGSASVQKTFNEKAFVNVGFSTQYTTFDGASLYHDGTIYTVTERTGFYITPQIYAFVDPSVDWRRYSDSTQNSNGYRVTGGVGTAASPSIWSGEIYGGYQAEKGDTLGTSGGDIFGVRLMYSPTRFWTLRATLDESLSAASTPTAPTTMGRTTTALLNVRYNGAPMGWSANTRFGYVHTTFTDNTRVDNGWLTGVNVGYAIWRNFGLTLDYQYKDLSSNTAGQSFGQHMVSLGLSYKY